MVRILEIVKTEMDKNWFLVSNEIAKLGELATY